MSAAAEWLEEQLRAIKRCRSWSAGVSLIPYFDREFDGLAAFLLEASALIAKMQPVSPELSHITLHLISGLLLPTSSSSTATAPIPNDHVSALRCLLTLPKESWDGQLGEAEMDVLMEGLNSPDDTIRRMVSHPSPPYFPNLNPPRLYDCFIAYPPTFSTYLSPTT